MFFVFQIELQLLEVLVLQKGRPKKLNCCLELDENQEEKLNTRGNSHIFVIRYLLSHICFHIFVYFSHELKCKHLAMSAIEVKETKRKN